MNITARVRIFRGSPITVTPDLFRGLIIFQISDAIQRIGPRNKSGVTGLQGTNFLKYVDQALAGLSGHLCPESRARIGVSS